MKARNEKVAEELRKYTAEFISRASNRLSLITVTRVNVSHDLKHATVYISVLPETREEQAYQFLLRQRTALREYLKKNLRLKRIPFLDIEKDAGERNRQKIDLLLRNT